MLAGDAVAKALALVDVTPHSVSQWLGEPCGCEERKEKLNALHAWVNRVVSGKLQGAKEHLTRMMS